MHRAIPVLLAIIMLLPTAMSRKTTSPAVPTLTVHAGAHDRHGTVTGFRLPAGLRASVYRLVDREGRVTYVQHDGQGGGWFILDELPAGTEKTFRLEALEGEAPPNIVGLVRTGTAVGFRVRKGPVLFYHPEKTEPPRPDVDPIYERGGYIHPVLTSSGTPVTDDYPPNHVHHHGIWGAWTKTVFEGRTPDFWNMGEGTGTVEPVALDTVWGGPVHGGFHARHRYVDLTAPTASTALNEAWAVRVYNVEGTGYRLFDLEVIQTAATDSPLHLPQYRYGGVGFRGNRQWDGAENTFFLTSEGKGRSDGHATRARWCHIGGYVDGRLAGIAILGHPDNFEAPQPMRIHPTEPFFNYAPSQAGDWSIQPGQPYVARYRYVVADGPPDADELDRLWNDYADPPEVAVVLR